MVFLVIVRPIVINCICRCDIFILVLLSTVKLLKGFVVFPIKNVNSMASRAGIFASEKIGTTILFSDKQNMYNIHTKTFANSKLLKSAFYGTSNEMSLVND